MPVLNMPLDYHHIKVCKKMLLMLVLGFASGMPLALTSSTLSAWLVTEGVDVEQVHHLLDRVDVGSAAGSGR